MNDPCRKYELRVGISGDTWDDVIHELRRVADHIEGHGETCNLSSGGSTCGAWVMNMIDPDMTHERYVEELKAWCAAKREQEKAKP